MRTMRKRDEVRKIRKIKREMRWERAKERWGKNDKKNKKRDQMRTMRKRDEVRKIRKIKREIRLERWEREMSWER